MAKDKVVEDVVEEVVEEVAFKEEVVEEAKKASVMVGTKEYNLEKKGREQAKQLSDIIRWLAQYSPPLFKAFSNEAGDLVFGNVLDNIVKISEVVSTDSLLELFVVVTGCSEKEAEKHFDIIDLIDGIIILFDNPKYRKVVDRFFSTVS